jgi:hypothetical protein
MKDENTNREITQERIFKQDVEPKDEAFKAISEAEQYLRQKGYTIGSMCGDEPIGFAKADKINYVAKWRNIPRGDYKKLSGIMIPFKHDDKPRDGFRDSWVKILFFREEG